jgi:hypothetical protein
MDPIHLSITLAAVMMSAGSILAVSSLLRCPDFVVMGRSALQTFSLAAITRLTVISLVLLSFLSIEGCLKFIETLKSIDTVNAALQHLSLFYLPMILMFSPVALAWIFRIILVKSIRGRRKIGQGIGIILALYMALLAACFAAAFYGLTHS